MSSPFRIRVKTAITTEEQEPGGAAQRFRYNRAQLVSDPRVGPGISIQTRARIPEGVPGLFPLMRLARMVDESVPRQTLVHAYDRAERQGDEKVAVSVTTSRMTGRRMNMNIALPTADVRSFLEATQSAHAPLPLYNESEQ